MKGWKTNYWIVLIMLMVTAVLSVDVNHYYKHSRYNHAFIQWDGKGYWSFLPAVFIYHDLNFGFFDSIDRKYYSHYEYDTRREVNGRFVNKYYAGMAFMLSPFFVLGHLRTLASDFSPDGYSMYYKMFLSIGALFYCLLGLWFIDRSLARFFNTPTWARVLIMVTAVFGTNLHYYTVMEPHLSHVYSFAAVSTWLYVTLAYFRQPRRTYLWMSALLLGLIVFIRPVNGLVVLSLPFLAGSWDALSLGSRDAVKDWKALIIAMLFAAACPFLQLLIYKLQCGNWLVYSYTNERINLQFPHVTEFLFSYKKGLLLYTPVLGLATVLIVIGLWRKRFALCSFFLFIGAVVYVLSSWWQWWYGGSFSSRAFTEYMPFAFVALGFAFSELRFSHIARSAITALFVVLIAFNQFQLWQYRHAVIHWDSMTKEMYWSVFLKPPPVNFFTGE
jgi:hypothetical protein